MAKWPIPVPQVLGELDIWKRSVYLQRDRILDPYTSALSRRADAQLLALALRQVLRLAESCRAVAPRSSRSAIDLALKKFNDTSPDIKDLRDVLDHMDEYLRGDGTQFPAGPPAQVYGPGIRIFIPITSWDESTDDTYVLNVMPAPGPRLLVLDVSRDAEAAIVLCDAVHAALR